MNFDHNDDELGIFTNNGLTVYIKLDAEHDGTMYMTKPVEVELKKVNI